jgi:hypothetical protein
VAGFQTFGRGRISAFANREADEKPVPEVAKRYGISAQTIHGDDGIV